MDRREALRSLIPLAGLGAFELRDAPNAGADMSRGRLPMQVHADDWLGMRVKSCTIDGLMVMDVTYADEVNGYVDHIRVRPEGFEISDGEGKPVRLVPDIPNTQLVLAGRKGSYPLYRTFGRVLLEFYDSSLDLTSKRGE
jgi:hypothetical protein